MGKEGRAQSEGKGSHQIRVAPDLGEMISWIIRLEGGTTVQLLDPMIRAQLTARYEKHKPAVEKIQAAEAEVERLEAEARTRSEPDVIPTPDRPPPHQPGPQKPPRRRKAE